MILSIIGIVIVFICFIWNIGFAPKGELFKNPMKLENTNCIRGMLAILILTHHFSGCINNNIVFSMFKHIGYLVVAAFFFLSGYGLCYGVLNKKDYLKGTTFFINRLPKIIFPYWIAVLVYAFIGGLTDENYTIREVMLSFISTKNIVGASWYIFELCLFYIMFFILFKLGNRKKLIISMSILLMILIILFVKIRVSYVWYRSIFGFLFGIVVAFEQDEIYKLLKKIKLYRVLLIGNAFMFIIIYILKVFAINSNNYIMQIVFDNLSSLLFVIVMYLLLYKVQFGNKLLKFLGNMSYEIYLMHMIFINLIYRFYVNGSINILIFYLSCIFGTVLTAYFLNKINKFILFNYNKLIKKIREGKCYDT